MALNAAQLAGSIKTAIEGYAGSGNTTAQAGDLARAIAEAVVTHIVASGTVVGVCPSGGGPLAGGKIV